MVAIELAPFPFEGLFDTDPTADFGPDNKCDVPIGRLPDGIVGKAETEGIIFDVVEVATACCC